MFKAHWQNLNIHTQSQAHIQLQVLYRYIYYIYPYTIQIYMPCRSMCAAYTSLYTAFHCIVFSLLCCTLFIASAILFCALLLLLLLCGVCAFCISIKNAPCQCLTVCQSAQCTPVAAVPEPDID